MTFCKRQNQKKEMVFPKPNFMTPEEFESGRRAWWETCVDDSLENLKTSVRWLKIIIIVMVILNIKKLIWP